MKGLFVMRNWVATLTRGPRRRGMARALAIVSMLALSLLVAMSAATMAGGPGSGGGGGGGGGAGGGGAGGGGGGGGGGRNTNPLIGSWRGSGAENNLFEFTFTKNFTFTMTEIDESTGVQVVTNLAGTYVLGPPAPPDGFPTLTLFADNGVVVHLQYAPAFEGMEIRGDFFAIIGRL
jgi:hypothetical protein